MRFFKRFAVLALAAFAMISLESCNKDAEPMVMDGVWKKSAEYPPLISYARAEGADQDSYETALSKFKAKENLVSNISKGVAIITNIEISGSGKRCTIFTKEGDTYNGTVEITYDTDSYKAFIFRIPEFVDMDADANSANLQIFFTNDYLFSQIIANYVTEDEYALFKQNIQLKAAVLYEK